MSKRRRIPIPNNTTLLKENTNKLTIHTAYKCCNPKLDL